MLGTLNDLKGWLTDIDYYVNYNANSVLSVTFRMRGVGAYPDFVEECVTVSLKTGRILKATDIFKSSSAKRLIAMLDRQMQAAVKKKLKENPDDVAEIKEQLAGRHYTQSDLDNFSVDDSGVWFSVTFGFPHVSKALEPEFAYFLSYRELSDHIKPGGYLGFAVPKQKHP